MVKYALAMQSGIARVARRRSCSPDVQSYGNLYFKGGKGQKNKPEMRDRVL